MTRASLFKLTIAWGLLLAAGCRTSQPNTNPLIDDPKPATTPNTPPTSQAEALATDPPTPDHTALPTSLTETPSSSLPATPEAPLSFNPATIFELEQVGLVEFTPWDLVLAVAWSPDAELIAVAAGESIYLYSIELSEQGRLDVGDWSTSLAFHPHGLWLASGGRDGQVRLWDVEQQNLVLTLAAHKKGVNAVAFSPDGNMLATAGNDAVARLWDSVTGERLAQMIGGTYAVPSIAFSPDGADLAITNGGLIRIRDVESSRFVHTLQNEDTNYSITRSPDGNLLAAGSTTGNVYLWDLSSGANHDTLLLPSQTGTAPASMVWSITFSPDGSLLAASNNDGTLRFWDVHNAELLISRSVIRQGITSLAFSPEGRYLVTGGLDGVLRLWAVR